MDFIKSDILIIGGGIAGCFAAIRASELGKSVVLLEKASIRRGGDVGPGMANGLNPGISQEGMTLEEAKGYARSGIKELRDPNVYLAVEKRAHQRVQDFEKFGVPVRDDDGSYFVWRQPDRGMHRINYRGKDTKVKLAEAVRKTNTTVVERTIGVDLLTNNGSVAGAVALNVRDAKVTAFLSKATILCTGDCDRQNLHPDGLFLIYASTTNSGDAQAMAYRAGAKLSNMEYMFVDYAVVRHEGALPGVKPWDKMPTLLNRNGEKVLKKEDIPRRGFIMVKEILEGRGPLYWDFRHLPEEDLKQMDKEMDHHFPICKEWWKQMGLDMRKTLIPMQLSPAAVSGGVIVDETLKTSMEGLYAAGAATAFISNITSSGSSGVIAAESASGYASEIEELPFEKEKAEALEKQIMAPLKRHGGTNPIDLEEAIRGVNTNYVGYFKSEGMMQAGLEKHLELRDAHLSSLHARNPHELMRCVEVSNIIDMAEAHIRASLMRTESRLRNVGLNPHYRVDYPKTDPSWEKLIVIRKEDGEMKLSTQEIPKLKEE